MFETWKVTNALFPLWVLVTIARLVLTGVTVVMLARMVFALAMRVRR